MKITLFLALPVLLVICSVVWARDKGRKEAVNSQFNPKKPKPGGKPSGKPNKKPDDGMFPHPAILAYSGCKLRTKSLPCNSKGHPHIQMGEAWANPRVLNQRVAFFTPYKSSHPQFCNQGGPYGDVIAYDCLPKKEDLVYTPNLASYCFLWEAGINGKTDNNGTMPDPPKGSYHALPPPMVCPSNLDPCYCKDWFKPGGKLGKYGNYKIGYKGLWCPPKTKEKPMKPLFCGGFDLGCKPGTYLEMQTEFLPKLNCTVSKCKTPKPLAEV